MQIIESSKNYDVVILGSGAGAGNGDKRNDAAFWDEQGNLIS